MNDGHDIDHGVTNHDLGDLFLVLFLASRKWRPTLVKIFETSNELITRNSGILPRGEWYVERLEATLLW